MPWREFKALEEMAWRRHIEQRNRDARERFDAGLDHGGEGV